MAPKTHGLVAHNATHYRVRIEVELECAHEPTPEELIRLTRIARGALDREAYRVREWSADVIRRPGGRKIDSMPDPCPCGSGAVPTRACEACDAPTCQECVRMVRSVPEGPRDTVQCEACSSPDW